MVQEANVKRAQAEKALAESEMKVRSKVSRPCGVRVLHNLSWLSECWNNIFTDAEHVLLLFRQTEHEFNYLFSPRRNGEFLLNPNMTSNGALSRMSSTFCCPIS